MEFEPGQVVDDRYEIIEKLGAGGMGVVWKARHQKLGDEVAVKTPLSQFDQEIISRFGKEARTMRKFSLECPNILNIEDIGDHEGLPWYAMRYLPGGSLRDRVLPRDSKGMLQWQDDSFGWLFKIAAALDFLHSQNAWHRDVKPENILFSQEGTPYLVDFGIVKTANESTSMMTDQSKAVGTMAYMAPEILDGGKFSPYSDQYSLAATLYEAVTGERPYGGTSFFALFKAIQGGHRKLNEIFSNFPQAASNVVDRALSQEPSDRFDNCMQFANSFVESLSESQPPSEAPTGLFSTPGQSPPGNQVVGGKLLAPVESPLKITPIVPVHSPNGEGTRSTAYIWAAVVAIPAMLVVGGVVCFFGLVASGLLPMDNGTSIAAVEPGPVSAVSESFAEERSSELLPNFIDEPIAKKELRETTFVEPKPEPKPAPNPKTEPKRPVLKIGAEVGNQIFELEGENLYGFNMRVSDLRGSIVLVDFWNPG